MGLWSECVSLTEQCPKDASVPENHESVSLPYIFEFIQLNITTVFFQAETKFRNSDIVKGAEWREKEVGLITRYMHDHAAPKYWAELLPDFDVSMKVAVFYDLVSYPSTDFLFTLNSEGSAIPVTSTLPTTRPSRFVKALPLSVSPKTLSSPLPEKVPKQTLFYCVPASRFTTFSHLCKSTAGKEKI